MYPNDNIIWQPTHLYQEHNSFEILLSRQFAIEMIEVTLSPKIQNRMNELGEEIAKRFRYGELSPYRFHEDTAFVRQININGGKGIWLALEGQFGNAPDPTITRPLKYTNNNMDSSFDTLSLLCLFDQWISFAETLKGLRI